MMQRAWPDIVEAMKSRSRMLWMLVKGNVTVGGFDGQTLTLSFANDGARNTFANRGGKDTLTEAIHQVLGMQVTLDLATGGGTPQKLRARPQQPTDPAPQASDDDHAPASSATHPPSPAPSDESPQWAPPQEPAPDEEPPHDAWQPGPEDQSWQTQPEHAPQEAARPRVPEKPVIPAFARRSQAAPASQPRTDGLEDVDDTPPRSRLPCPHPEEPEDPAAPRRTGQRPHPPLEPVAQTSRPVSPQHASRWAGPEDPEEDVPSEDDEEIMHSGVFGRRAIERLLGGTLIEERRLGAEGH